MQKMGLRTVFKSYDNLCRAVEEINGKVTLLQKPAVNEPDNKTEVLTNYNIVNPVWGGEGLLWRVW